MKRLAILAMATMLLPSAAVAQPVQTDQERANALVLCLVNSSTSLEHGLVRNMLIAGLEEDFAPGGAYLRAILGQVVTIATTICGAPTNFGAEAWAANVPTRYIDVMIGMAIQAAMTGLTTLPEGGAAPAPAPAPAPLPFTVPPL